MKRAYSQQIEGLVSQEHAKWVSGRTKPKSPSVPADRVSSESHLM